MLRAIYGTPFGIADPIFSRDIGFYVFTLPALSAAIGFLTTLSRLCLFLLIPLYWMRGDVVLGPRGLSIEPAAGLHLAILLAVLFLLTALRLWMVEIPDLLYSTTGPLVGASYTDLHAELPALRVSAVLAMVVAVAVLIGGLQAAARPVRGAGDRRLRGRGRRSAAASSRRRCRSSSWRRPS